MKETIKKLMSKTLITTLLFSQVTIADTLIQAEDTQGKYIKAVELDDNRYRFLECTEINQELDCTSLFNDQRTFSRSDIYKLSRRNRRNAIIAGVADVGILAISLYLGVVGAAYGSAAYYTAAGASLDGGVAAVGGFIFGAPTGGAAAAGVTIAASDLDPFMHRDISLAMKEVIQMADEDELDDIEAQVKDYGTVVQIEDISYDRLVHKLKSQLEDL